MLHGTVSTGVSANRFCSNVSILHLVSAHANKAGARQRVRPRRAHPPSALPHRRALGPFARPRSLRAGRFATICHAKHAPSFRLLSAKSGRAQSGTPASLVSAYITIFTARTPEVAARPAAANLIGRHAAAVKRRNPLPACSAAKQARIQKRSSGVRSSDHILPSPAPSRLRPTNNSPTPSAKQKQTPPTPPRPSR